MATATERPQTKDAAREGGSELTLDTLARLAPDDLVTRYRRGRIPSSLRALDGTPPGRLLAVVGPVGRGVVGRVLRAWGASDGFPWAGKTFKAIDDTRGWGRNRLRIGRTVEVVPFETRVEPSAIDGRPCVRLDYDSAGNPFPVRRIRDELREVAPGVFMGPAFWTGRRGPSPLLWFGVAVAAGQNR